MNALLAFANGITTHRILSSVAPLMRGISCLLPALKAVAPIEVYNLGKLPLCCAVSNRAAGPGVTSHVSAVRCTVTQRLPFVRSAHGGSQFADGRWHWLL
mmetsp:Transcript_29867/g.91673  ORF Transcript_29867/g.91673 Transcript_29867/m.91673 type:complete len:100 (+) Transcript_29867:850-1149(+)